MSTEANSLTSIFFALGANAAIACAKLFAALYTGSGAMLAEAIHSAADCGNQGLLLLGVQHSKKPPTVEYPLGFGKAIYFWSFIVALLLFSVGGLFSIYEGLHKLESHDGLRGPWLAVGILVFSVVMEGVSLGACLREVNKDRGGRGFWRWFRETRQSALLVVLGEDIAALAGLVLALIALLLAIVTGDPVYDAAGSIAIGLLLVLVAVAMGLQIKKLLIGQSVEPRLRAAISDCLQHCEEVDGILNLITLQLGDDVMVAVKARMRTAASAVDMVKDINLCEAELKARFPAIRWIFFEPDIAD
jgi:cation diffusion facilitator family transporter